MERRIRWHDELSTWLRARSDDELISLIGETEGTAGWGVTRTIEIEGRAVFLKTLPLTGSEPALERSTRIVFNLPLVYNYGVGSAGFGAFREVEGLRRATQWVTSGLMANFPLLHHDRVLPIAAQTRSIDADSLDEYVRYWGDDLNIRQFIEERQASTHSVALFMEHFPHVLQDWLPHHQAHVSSVIDQALEATTFMRSQGVVHLDAHSSNVMTDGETIYFSDFGLVLDAAFDLSPAEVEFLERHRFFDIAEFLCGLDPDAVHRGFEADAAYRAAVQPYRPLMSMMTSFFRDMLAGPSRDAVYDDALAARLLGAAVSS